MLPHIIFRSLQVRRQRLTVATLAVLLAAALLTALVNLSLDIGARAGEQLEAYGPNVLLLPKAMSLPAGAGNLAFGDVTGVGYLEEKALSFAKTDPAGSVKAYVPYLYAIAEGKGQKMVVAGVRFDGVRLLFPHWQLAGNWPQGENGGNQGIAGSNVARQLSLVPGDEVELSFGGRSRVFRITGIAQVGGSEDNQIFIDLETARELAQRPGQLDLAQLRVAAGGKELELAVKDLSARMPEVRVRIVGQIAGAEEKVLFKVQLLIGLITALVLVVSMLAVFSTISASVLERTREVGLMKALGARSRVIALSFVAEAWAMGLVGGTVGLAVGLGLGQLIGRHVFNAYLSFYPAVVPVTFFTALATTTLASLWPVMRALSVEPVMALRGE